VLVLDNNEVSSHVTFPHLPKLHTLWLNHNKVENLALFISSARCAPERGFAMPAPLFQLRGIFPVLSQWLHRADRCSPFAGLEGLSPVEDPQHDEQSSGAFLL
jgi:hypothetical protein